MSPLSPEQQRLVLDGAVQLIGSRNLKDVTLEELARVSGVSGFDIVRHYHSKEGILTAVLERELELMAAAVSSPELRLPGETLRDELHMLARIILEEYRRRLPFMRNVLAEAMGCAQVGGLFYRNFIVQGRQLFAEFLNARKAKGELREGLDLEAASAMFLASLTGSLLMFELFGGSQVETLDDERLVQEMSDVFLRGVAKK